MWHSQCQIKDTQIPIYTDTRIHNYKVLEGYQIPCVKLKIFKYTNTHTNSNPKYNIHF